MAPVAARLSAIIFSCADAIDFRGESSLSKSISTARGRTTGFLDTTSPRLSPSRSFGRIQGATPRTFSRSLGAHPLLGEGFFGGCENDQRKIRNGGDPACFPRCGEISALLDSRRRVLRVVATRSCMCDCPASTTRPDLPSHWQYPTRYGDSVTTRLEALGQCIPPSQDGNRNREGTIFLPASRRIGARVSGRVSRCEPL